MIEQLFRFIAWIVDVFNFLWIIAAATLLGMLVGGIIYFSNQTLPYLIFSLLVVFAGFIIGIVWAVNVWKNQGTTNFISRINASPELNKNTEENQLESEIDEEHLIEMTPNNKIN